MSTAASYVQPPYVCSSQLSGNIMHNSHTLHFLMHTSSLMQVAPELSPPPPPPGTVAVNITGGNNGSPPIVTVNSPAGLASPAAAPVVEQPPLASPLSPAGGPLNHCQLAWTLALSIGFTLCTRTNCICVCWLFCVAELCEQAFILFVCLVRIHARVPAACHL